MPHISRVRQSKHADYCILYIENEAEEYVLKLHKNTYVDYQLHPDQEISLDLLTELTARSEVEKVVLVIKRYQRIRPHSAQEVKLHLRKKKYIDPIHVEPALALAKETGVIDEQYFAEWYAEQKLGNGRHGQQKVLAELLKKGISGDIAKQAISAIAETIPEEEVTHAIVEQIAKSRADLSDFNTKQKLIQKLLRKGYKYDQIKIALAQAQDSSR